MLSQEEFDNHMRELSKLKNKEEFDNHMREISKAKNKKIIIIVLIAIGFVVFMFIININKEKEVVNKASPENAYYISQQFVEDRLKSPASAEFPRFSNSGVSVSYTGNDTYKVSAYVDAQNSFGALIRTYYKCEARYNKSSDKWMLIDLKMDE